MKPLQDRVAAMTPSPLGAIGRSALPFVVAALLAVFVDVVIGPAVGPTWTKILLDVGIAIVLAGSLNVVNGYAGQFSIGQAGFMLIGAYAAAWLTFYGQIHFFGPTCPAVGPECLPVGVVPDDPSVYWRSYVADAGGGTYYCCFGGKGAIGGFLGNGQLLFLTGCILGGVVAAVFGVLVGLPSLRLRGDYLAIVTLGFGEIVRVLGQMSARQPKKVSDIEERSLGELANNLGGAEGFSQIPGYTRLVFVYFFALVLLILIYRLKYSSKGRALLAVRENEIAAEAMGVDTTRAKVVAFVFSAFFAGIGGALYAHQVSAIDPKEIAFQKSIDLVIIVVIGGMGSITGVVLGASILVVLPELFREFSDYRMIAYALALILVMIMRPQGIMGVQEIWEVPWTRRTWWIRGLEHLKARRNTIALCAVGLAAIGLFKVAPLIVGAAAIAASVVARRFARAHEGSGVGLATLAFLVGIIDVLFGLVWLARGYLQVFMESGVRLDGFSDYRLVAYAIAVIVLASMRLEGHPGAQDGWEVPWLRRAWWQRGLDHLRTRRNTAAVVAVGLAVIGACQVLPLIAGGGAIAASVRARRFARSHDDSGFGIATAALLLGIVAALFGFGWLTRGYLQVFMDNGVKLW